MGRCNALAALLFCGFCCCSFRGVGGVEEAGITVVTLASVILEAVLRVLTDRLELRSDCGVEEEEVAGQIPGIVAKPFVPIVGSSLLAPRPAPNSPAPPSLP